MGTIRNNKFTYEPCRTCMKMLKEGYCSKCGYDVE